MCVHHSSSWTPSPGALVSLWYHIYQPAHQMLYLKYWPSLPLLTVLAPQWLRPFISLQSTYTHSTRISLIQSLLHMLRRCQWFSMTYPCPGLPDSIQLIYFPPPPPQILPNLFSDILNFSPQPPSPKRLLSPKANSLLWSPIGFPHIFLFCAYHFLSSSGVICNRFGYRSHCENSLWHALCLSHRFLPTRVSNKIPCHGSTD